MDHGANPKIVHNDSNQTVLHALATHSNPEENFAEIEDTIIRSVDVNYQDNEMRWDENTVFILH